MIKLTLTLEGEKLHEYVLDKERTTLGRTPQNDIQIENLGISGSHAAIVRHEGFWTVEDLGSKNGTRVNDDPIAAPRRLKSGDVIGIVKYRLVFSDVEENADEDAGRETMRIDPKGFY